MKPQTENIIEVLQTVKDPEIDSVSIVELGMLKSIEEQDGILLIKLLPTFVGCPALDIIKGNVMNALKEQTNITNVNVEFVMNPPWTSDRVSAEGREKLKQFGIAPPPKKMEEDGSWHVDCPYCGSTYTTLDNIFGPTACRSILYCKNCKNPFEAMKPISTLM